MTSNHPLTKKAREDIWNNPAKDMLTDEQKDEFKVKGKHMYDQMDFGNIESDVLDAVAYIRMQLRSGVHPSFLEDNERDIMQKIYGDDWETLEYMYRPDEKNTHNK